MEAAPYRSQLRRLTRNLLRLGCEAMLVPFLQCKALVDMRRPCHEANLIEQPGLGAFMTEGRQCLFGGEAPPGGNWTVFGDQWVQRKWQRETA